MSEKQNLERVERSIVVRAPRERVFEAITRPELLEQWFAEHTDIELRPGGRYAYWGSRTFKVADREAAVQVVESVDAPRELSVRTAIEGQVALFTYRLEEVDGATTVSLGYDLPGNAKERAWYLAIDDSALMLYNLRAFVESGEPDISLDFRTPKDRMELRIRIDASSDDVFQALVDPEVMAKWLSGKAEVDPRPGGTYRYGWTETVENGKTVDVGPQKLISIEPGVAVEHDWHYLDETPTQVRWRVEGKEGSTILSINHFGFGPSDDVPSYVQGWAAFLCKLKAVMEGQAVAPLAEAAAGH
jgi:uncharacterized protein YndB with AHSA1/START domain